MNMMTKREFLNELENKLLLLDADERDDIIVEHMHHINDLMKNGKTEEEAVRSFGNVSVLASELLKAYNIEFSDSNKTSSPSSMNTQSSNSNNVHSSSLENSYETAKDTFIKPVKFINGIYDRLANTFDDVYDGVSLDDRKVGYLSRGTSAAITSLIYIVIYFTGVGIMGAFTNSIGIAFFEVIFIILTVIVFFGGIVYALPVIKHIFEDFNTFFFNRYVTREIVKESQISVYKGKPTTLAYAKNGDHYAIYSRKELKVEQVIGKLHTSDVNYEKKQVTCEKLKIAQVKSLQKDAVKRIEYLGKVTAKEVKDSDYKEELKRQKQQQKDAIKLQKAETKVAVAEGIAKGVEKEMDATVNIENQYADIAKAKIDIKMQKKLAKQQSKLAKQQAKMAAYGDSKAIEIEIKETKRANKQSSGLDTARTVLAIIFSPVQIAMAIATTVCVVAGVLLLLMGLGNIGFTLLTISAIFVVLATSSIVKMVLNPLKLKPIKIRSVVWTTILLTSAVLLSLFGAKLAGYPGLVDLVEDYVVFVLTCVEDIVGFVAVDIDLTAAKEAVREGITSRTEAGLK